jgi:uncharacterized protein YihD (DUF1040 family)|tara:strand:- start:177 stop:374 length:198 start_codon:yes stop_codon:yes gene_type:complete
MKKRQPSELAVILNVVQRYWEKHPDLRLAQIICNAQGQVFDESDPYLYYMDDDELVDALKEMGEI